MASAVSGDPESARFAVFLEQVLFEDPWADPETPSLVYVEDGQIMGTIGASTRRMRFDGQSIRVVVSAFFWTHPSVRSRGVGARLLRALLLGPQDLTITDGATDAVRRMWEILGGRTAHLNCFAFHRILRPFRFTAVTLERRGSLPRLGHVLATACNPLDGLAQRFARGAVVPAVPPGEVEPLTPESLLESFDHVTRGTRLRGAYDLTYLEWLCEQLARVDSYELFWLEDVRGATLAERVLKSGEPLGWYVCQLSTGGRCHVLQLAASERGAPTVIAQLMHRAFRQGAIAVSGRVEGHLVAPLLHQRGLLLRFTPAGRRLIHARDTRIVNAVLTGDAFLTKLDGEWWV